MTSSAHRHHPRNQPHGRQEREYEREHGPVTIVLLGGTGGLEARYRTAVEDAGYTLKYCEQRVHSTSAASAHRVAAVLVVVTMVSHPLMAQARKLAGEHAPIVYLKSHSVSALRQALQQLRASRSQRAERQVA